MNRSQLIPRTTSYLVSLHLSVLKKLSPQISRTIINNVSHGVNTNTKGATGKNTHRALSASMQIGRVLICCDAIRRVLSQSLGLLSIGLTMLCPVAKFCYATSRVLSCRGLIVASLPMELNINVPQITRKCKPKTDEDGKSRPGRSVDRTLANRGKEISMGTLSGIGYRMGFTIAFLIQSLDRYSLS